VQRASRYDLVRALAPRYAHVGKLEKGQLLDEVCQLTGYTRKRAVALLRHPPPDEPTAKRTRHRLASYGQAEVELLQLCWLVTGPDPVWWTFRMSRAKPVENVHDDRASKTLLYTRVQGADR
jgi:hypothetical protein